MASTYLDQNGLEYLVSKIETLLARKIAENIPVGTVLAWYGSVNDIPGQYGLCDGTKGTPDLRDRFILGRKPATQEVDETLSVIIDGTDPITGGSSSVELSVDNLPPHTHTVSGVTITTSTEGGSLFSGGEDLISASDTGETGETGGGTPVNITPPYYRLYYIMKLDPKYLDATDGPSAGEEEEVEESYPIVPTFADLPTEGINVGDIYFVDDVNQTYIWDGTQWSEYGEITGGEEEGGVEETV